MDKLGDSGGIVGALLLFFGETRQLQFFPVGEVKSIALAILLLYNIAFLSLRLFSISLPEIRLGKLRWSDEAFSSSVPRVIFRFLVSVASMWAALTLPISVNARIVIVVPFAISTLWTIVALIYSRLKFPLGN